VLGRDDRGEAAADPGERIDDAGDRGAARVDVFVGRRGEGRSGDPDAGTDPL